MEIWTSNAKVLRSRNREGVIARPRCKKCAKCTYPPPVNKEHPISEEPPRISRSIRKCSLYAGVPFLVISLAQCQMRRSIRKCSLYAGVPFVIISLAQCQICRSIRKCSLYAVFLFCISRATYDPTEIHGTS